MRLQIANRFGMLAKVLSAIAKAKGDPGAVDVVRADPDFKVRDLMVSARDDAHAKTIVDAVRKIEGITVLHVSDRIFLLHLGGKIRIQNKIPLTTRDALSMAYTPGVARVCLAIRENDKKANTLTIKQNSVAVVSDGTAVLGLGDIGPKAAMPVMEGKAMLFKEFADIDAYPICLATKNVAEIVNAVKWISPGFGAINLEDISAPRCFEIERQLKAELDIPVFHDDQHGTAVVVLAATLNALKLVGKDLADLRIVIAGAGAAGVAITKILLAGGARDVICCDRAGVISKKRLPQLDASKTWLAQNTNPRQTDGSLADALKGAHLFIGVSGPFLVKEESIRQMAKNPIVFALANPTPEIMPEEAAAARAKIIATGRSDYPNQINNALCFPGVFRGALDARAGQINEAMKLAAARAIAGCVKDDELCVEYIVPSIFNKNVVPRVARAVEDAAYKTGAAKRQRR